MNGPILPQTTFSDLPGLLRNRACRPCVSIKAKCVPLAGSEDQTCERCHRLGKTCTTPQPKVRKRAAVHDNFRHGSSLPDNDKISPPVLSPQLRQRALPQSTASVPSLYAPSTASHTSAMIPTPSVSSIDHYLGSAKTTSLPNRPDGSLDTSSKGRALPLFATAFEISPEIGHAFIYPAHEKLFEYFHDQMSPHFPFITLTMETAKMRQDRPFTYVACVNAAAQSDPTFQTRITRDILKYLGDHMLLRGEKSLDLLQGLLIMINWYHVYRNSNPQLMNLVHLAKALLVDLALNRRRGASSFQIIPSETANKMIHGQQQDNGSSHHSLEDRRACLGAYHVQAKLAASYRRLDTMPWSEHIEECCQILSESMERTSDTYAVALVRLDHLVDRYRNIDAGQQKLTMPVQTYVRLFSADLESFKQSLPFHLQNDADFNLHIQTSQVCLFERIINSDCDIPSHKVEALHTCLAGVVGYFNSFVSQKLEYFPCLSFLTWSTIVHAFDMYAKLSFVEVSNWDLEYVRHSPGFVATVDTMIETFKKAQALEDIRNPESKSVRFNMSIGRLEMFKQWYSSRVDLESKTRMERLQPHIESNATGEESNAVPYFSDFADIVWQDFTTDWSWFDNTFSATTWPQQSV